MRVLAACASLKGVLSAQEASAAVAEGFRAVGIPADASPIADGGEGTADVLAAALGGEWSDAQVS
ncbi:MAG: glycerate kinase, partial [Actinomycetota bacterium]|nr:glycerate kinase [Actinomycetota bacterium]